MNTEVRSRNSDILPRWPRWPRPLWRGPSPQKKPISGLSSSSAGQKFSRFKGQKVAPQSSARPKQYCVTVYLPPFDRQTTALSRNNKQPERLWSVFLIPRNQQHKDIRTSIPKQNTPWISTPPWAWPRWRRARHAQAQRTLTPASWAGDARHTTPGSNCVAGFSAATAASPSTALLRLVRSATTGMFDRDTLGAGLSN